MNMESIYKCLPGRMAIVCLRKTGVFRLASGFLRTNMSTRLIPGYIKKHQIDMSDFEGQKYRSFAEFFARKRAVETCVLNPEMLISPCDGLLSIYPIGENLIIPMKGSLYCLNDLLPDKEVTDHFMNGICLVFRLQASDYHHFCAFDDVLMKKAEYIPGELHSVQPIACERLPVYRLNRRWWSLLETAHFGPVVQIEVGAMLVGGVHFAKESGWLCRGEEMGNFELAGSTVLIMLSSGISERLEFDKRFSEAYKGKVEKPVLMGEEIGVLKNEKEIGIVSKTIPALT